MLAEVTAAGGAGQSPPEMVPESERVAGRQRRAVTGLLGRPLQVAPPAARAGAFVRGCWASAPQGRAGQKEQKGEEKEHGDTVHLTCRLHVRCPLTLRFVPQGSPGLSSLLHP